MKRTTYKVVHCTPEENQDGKFHYITCLEPEVAGRIAKNLRDEKDLDYHIVVEKHHEVKEEYQNEWGWQVDWEAYPENAVEIVEYY